MIHDEFLLIAARSLKGHKGSDSVRILSIQPGSGGPDIEWTAPLLSRRRERSALGVLGPPAGPLVLNLLSGTLAARWRNGAPHCPSDWDRQLAKRYRRIFGIHGPATGPGWCWLFEAAAQAIKAAGIPKNMRTTEIKEKYGTLRWTVDASEDCSDVEEILDAVENLSAFICEDCGRPGRIREGGWLRCECNHCYERRKT